MKLQNKLKKPMTQFMNKVINTQAMQDIIKDIDFEEEEPITGMDVYESIEFADKLLGTQNGLSLAQIIRETNKSEDIESIINALLGNEAS